MTQKDKLSQGAESQRSDAEKKAAINEPLATKNIEAFTQDESHHMAHELKVHQIELESQNEELRNTQLKLEESRNRYFALYDLAPFGDITVSKDGLISQANLTAGNLLNLERGSLVGKSIGNFIIKDDQDAYYLFLNQLIKTGEAQICELRIKRNNDGEIWVRLESTCSDRVLQSSEKGDSEGYGYRIILSDISERKQAEETSRLTEVRYKTLFQNLNSSSSLYEVITDKEGKPCDYRIVAVNPMYEKTVGVKASSVIGKTLLEAFPQTESAWMEILHAVAVSGNLFSIENFSQEMDKWIELTVYAPEPGQIAMIGSDITPRKKAELALSAEKERLAVTLRSIGEGVITTDSDGKITMLNNAAEEMTGWNSDDAVGHPLPEVFHIIDELTGKEFGNLVEEVITTGATVSLANHTRLIAKDGREIITSSSGTPLRDDEGRGIGVVLVFRDMTEEQNALAKQDKLTEQLHQSQKMDAIGQLAGGIAHDFNNALGGIIGAADLLLCGDLDKAQQKEFIDMILLAADRAGDLTKKLLLFSRNEKKETSTIDMTKIVTDTVDLLAHVIDKNISISIENSAINTTISGDDSQLQNAIMNTAINASHAMPKGGTLTFTLENLTLDAEYCAVSPFDVKPGDYVSISVRDSGCGMSPETQSHIFEPFYTTKEQGKGTGLGLATAYGTIQDHFGAITVYSELGSGTVFHLYFPVTEAVSDTIKEEKVVSGTGTILVIDDEEMIRITASAQLTSLGYKVFCAENGKIGVNTFKENRGEIDLVILDMIMPVMGGREAFGKLREIDPNIPVIISSGFSKEDDILAMKTGGVSGFLNKPFRRVELANMVRSAMSNS
jgi:PAS domain S-box-containing protein